MAEGDRVRPAKPWATVADDGDGELKITIPIRRPWYDWCRILVVAAFLTGWVGMGLHMVFCALRDIMFHPSGSGSILPLLMGLVIFATGAAFLLYLLLWRVWGQEVVLVDATSVAIRKELPLRFLWTQSFDPKRIRNLRVAARSRSIPGRLWAAAVNFHRFMTDPHWTGTGTIAFDYRNRTHRFAAGLDEAEAEESVARIIERFPSMGRRA